MGQQASEKREHDAWQGAATKVDYSTKTKAVAAPLRGAAAVTASSGLTQADGFSRNNDATSATLKRIHYPLWEALSENVKNRKKKGGGIFSCAEPNALAALINKLGQGTNTDLAAIRIGYTKNSEKGLIEAPCPTCAQWLSATDGSSYKISAKILSATEASLKKKQAAKAQAPGATTSFATSNRFDTLLDDDGDGDGSSSD